MEDNKEILVDIAKLEGTTDRPKSMATAVSNNELVCGSTGKLPASLMEVSRWSSSSSGSDVGVNEAFASNMDQTFLCHRQEASPCSRVTDQPNIPFGSSFSFEMIQPSTPGSSLYAIEADDLRNAPPKVDSWVGSILTSLILPAVRKVSSWKDVVTALKEIEQTTRPSKAHGGNESEKALCQRWAKTGLRGIRRSFYAPDSRLMEYGSLEGYSDLWEIGSPSGT